MTLLFGLGACDDGPSKEELRQAEELARARKALEQKALAERRAEEEAAKKAAEEEAAAKAAEVREKAADRMEECCTALGKAAFEGRSMTYQKAADACEAARGKEGGILGEFRPDLKKLLDAEPLPPACQPADSSN